MSYGVLEGDIVMLQNYMVTIFVIKDFAIKKGHYLYWTLYISILTICHFLPKDLLYFQFLLNLHGNLCNYLYTTNYIIQRKCICFLPSHNLKS